MALAYSVLLDQYEQYLRVEKNLSEKTRKAYLYDLTRFGAHLAGDAPGAVPPPPAKIAPDAIRGYLNYLQEELGYRSATLARTIASIRIFFDFCEARQAIPKSPAAQIRNPKQPKKLPVYLVKGELVKLLQAPDRSKVGGVRDFAILATLSFTGTRLSELVGLNVRDANLEHRTIRVTGKGSKERVVPMNEVVIGALGDWLKVRPSVESPALFLNRFDKRLSGRMVENIVRKHALAAGVFRERLSPHKLRHTFATLLHSNDVDILEIQALLGHASITSTQIYTHTSSARLQAAVEKLESIRPEV